MHPRELIRRFFAAHGIAPCRVLAAVSGGVDSTALLLLLASLRDDGFRISAAHVNHRLRGAESDGDEAFVRELCARFDIPLDVAAGALDRERIRARGIEAAAREVRYARLREIREKQGAPFVATAHQKDDQAETVLMRLLTGSGIAGLRGIHPMRDDGFIRPLLGATRAQLEDVLAEHGVAARLDRSNDDPRFLRNRLRVVIRELGATENLARVADEARAQWPLMERLLDDEERACAEVRETETRFARLPENEWLRGALLRRHVRRLDPDARDFDVRRIDPAAKRVTVTKNVELVHDATGWRLRQRPIRRPLFSGEIAFTNSAHIPELGVTVHVGPCHPERAQRVEGPPAAERRARQLFQLPPDAHPLFTVRTRRAGDRFHPLGMARPKKLKDFLIDRKIERGLRERLPLLLWNGEIVWIAGVEVSERFKVTRPAHGALYEVWLEGTSADDADHSPL